MGEREKETAERLRAARAAAKEGRNVVVVKRRKRRHN